MAWPCVRGGGVDDSMILGVGCIVKVLNAALLVVAGSRLRSYLTKSDVLVRSVLPV